MVLRAGLRSGFITAAVAIFLILIGVPSLMGTLFQEWFSLDSQMPGAWALLAVIGLWAGSGALERHGTPSWGKTLAAGAIAGVTLGLVLGGVTAFLANLVAQGADVRSVLPQLSTPAINLLTAGRAAVPAAITMFAVMVVSALAGATIGRLRRLRRREASGPGLIGRLRQRWAESPAAARFNADRRLRWAVYGLGFAALLVLPMLLDQYGNYTLGTVGIYVILGLGINIIVGMSGLLVLGYAAFFAVGAYTVALLTAPLPYGIMMNFWLTIPIGIALASLAAILLGLPVLRMRGDYLAIVTLGFGEIIRILIRSDVLLPYTGGPRGIRSVGHPMLFGRDIGNEFYFMYIILAGIILAIVLTRQIEKSRHGRAWRAMKEDERVAQAMGIYTLKYRLLALAAGAGFAGLAGVLFASRNTFTGPEDYTLLVSINVLALLIVGGMGSVPGIILGAVALKGLPEMLRQLSDYRILVFGALLVVMMILRPQGLWPASSRQMERRDEAEPPQIAEAEAEYLAGPGGEQR